MKFSTAIIATTLLASSALAMPTNEERDASPGLRRAGKFNNWCIGPGQMCFKTKRDLDQAATDILHGYYVTDPDTPIEKLEASPLRRAGKFNNWCIGPGQMCFKTKRDLDDAATDILHGWYVTDPDTIEKREASPLRKFNNWCIGPGQMCFKNKRDLDHAVDHVVAGFEAPTPEQLEKREAAPLRRAGKFNNWCIGPGQMCFKSKRDFDEATSLIAAGYEAPLPEQ